MSYDPRGGIWYLDSHYIYPSGRRLVHFDTEDGYIIEEIVIDELIDDGKEYIPMSIMEICGINENLTMIVSANNHTELPFHNVENYVIAINLTDNSLLWKVLVESDVWLNYAGGQYTILMDENLDNPRVLFAKWLGGVMAIGEESNGSVEDCLGPYNSGIEVSASHACSKGSYKNKVKVKNICGVESNWATFDVNLARNIVLHNSSFLKLLEKFPLLQQLFYFLK
jgi:hypothetical protein